jgi:hypothetical protein
MRLFWIGEGRVYFTTVVIDLFPIVSNIEPHNGITQCSFIGLLLRLSYGARKMKVNDVAQYGAPQTHTLAN